MTKRLGLERLVPRDVGVEPDTRDDGAETGDGAGRGVVVLNADVDVKLAEVLRIPTGVGECCGTSSSEPY